MFSNALMNMAIKFNTLLAQDATTKDLPDNWVKNFVNIIFDILGWVAVLVAAAATIYAVILGINMARADSAEKREEAKQRIVYTLIGVLICIVLIIVFFFVANNIESWLKGMEYSPAE